MLLLHSTMYWLCSCAESTERVTVMQKRRRGHRCQKVFLTLNDRSDQGTMTRRGETNFICTHVSLVSDGKYTIVQIAEMSK